MKKLWTDEAEIEEFLRESETGCLAAVDPDGWPYVVPLNYVRLHGSTFFHSGSGLKTLCLERDVRVAFAVVEPLSLATNAVTGETSPCRISQLGRSVLIRGRAWEVKEPRMKLEILDAFIAKYDPQAGRLRDRYPDLEDLAAQPFFAACRTLEIEAVSMTARRLLLENRPYSAAAADRLEAGGSPRDLKSALLLRSLQSL